MRTSTGIDLMTVSGSLQELRLRTVVTRSGLERISLSQVCDRVVGLPGSAADGPEYTSYTQLYHSIDSATERGTAAFAQVCDKAQLEWAP